MGWDQRSQTLLEPRMELTPAIAAGRTGKVLKRETGAVEQEGIPDHPAVQAAGMGPAARTAQPGVGVRGARAAASSASSALLGGCRHLDLQTPSQFFNAVQ